jgi:hypothetical protein
MSQILFQREWFDDPDNLTHSWYLCFLKSREQTRRDEDDVQEALEETMDER